MVIPVYNGADLLSDAIESALAQTWQAVEVLVVNDGSDDGGHTAGVAARYGDRIRYFEKENGGVASALNLGIREMRGEWFCWLSHDDLYLPRRVEASMGWLADHPQYRACYSDYRLVGKGLAAIEDVICPWLPREEALRRMMGHHYIGGCTVTVHRTVFEQVGVFAEGLRLAQDLEMWLRILFRFEMGRVPEVLVLTRVHDGQGSVTAEARMIREGLGVVIQTLQMRGLPGVTGPLGDPGVRAADRARAFVHVGDNLVRARRPDSLTLELYRQAWRAHPTPLNGAWLRMIGWVRAWIADPEWRILAFRIAPGAVRRVQSWRRWLRGGG